MKNLGKLFTVLLGALAVMAFAGCSSPSSGGSAKAYKYKMEFKISSPSSVAWEKTIYFKIGETASPTEPHQPDAVLIPYDDEACTVGLRGKDSQEANNIDCYHCNDGNIRVSFNANGISYYFGFSGDDITSPVCYVWIDGVNFEDLQFDYLKIDGKGFTAAKTAS